MIRGLVRPIVRSGVSSLVGQGASLAAIAAAALNDAVDQDDIWAWWDMTSDDALYAGVDVGGIADTPNLSVTRASGGYAETEAGTLEWFGSNTLRRTDKGLLVEGAGTNLLTYSQDFTDADWAKSNATVTANTIAAPDGSMTGDTVTAAAGAGAGCQVYQAWTATGTSLTYSIYAKQGSGAEEANFFGVRNNTTAATVIAGYLNYSTGSWTYAQGSTGVVVTALDDGWYRITISVTSGITATDAIRVYVGFSGAADTPARFCYAWGAQLEASAFPTSYIPTTSSSATRAADVALIGSVTGLDYPLTMFAEFERAGDTGGGEVLLGVNETGNDRSEIRVDNVDRFGSLMVDGGSVVANVAVTGVLSVDTIYKGAARLAGDSVNAALGGSSSTEDTDTGSATPNTPNAITFGMRSSGSDPFNGYLRRIAIYPEAKADAVLEAMTT